MMLDPEDEINVLRAELASARKGALRIAESAYTKCPDWKRTMNTSPDGWVSWRETLCNHASKMDCVFAALRKYADE